MYVALLSYMFIPSPSVDVPRAAKNIQRISNRLVFSDRIPAFSLLGLHKYNTWLIINMYGYVYHYVQAWSKHLSKLNA